MGAGEYHRIDALGPDDGACPEAAGFTLARIQNEPETHRGASYRQRMIHVGARLIAAMR